MSTNRTILWAIEAGADLEIRNAQMAKVLRELEDGSQARIHPVCILKKDETSESRLREWLASLDLPGLSPVKVVRPDSLTAESIASALVACAEQHHADLIALSTHARRGLSHLLLGSVSETVLQRWKVPALIVNPARPTDRPVTHMLFPTDFSARSRLVFERAVRLARERGATLYLYHVRNLLPLEASVHAAEWAIWAKRAHGVTVETRLEESPVGTASAILVAAQRLDCGLIVMASAAGPVRAALVGSVARDVISSADCAVLAWHPAEKEERKKRAVFPGAHLLW